MKQQIQMPGAPAQQQFDPKEKEHAKEVNKLIEAWAATEIYTGTMVGFKPNLINGMRHFSAATLQMPIEDYLTLAKRAVSGDMMTYQETNNAIQILCMSSCEQLGHALLSDYISFQSAVRDFALTFDTDLKAGIAKIREDNPYVAEVVENLTPMEQIMGEDVLNVMGEA